MNVNSASPFGATSSLGGSGQFRTNASAIAPKTSFEQILEDFKKVASQTPAERAADGVLKKHGLTKDQFDKLPQAKKDGIVKEIEEAVRRAVGAKEKPGSYSTRV